MLFKRKSSATTTTTEDVVSTRRKDTTRTSTAAAKHQPIDDDGNNVDNSKINFQSLLFDLDSILNNDGSDSNSNSNSNSNTNSALFRSSNFCSEQKEISIGNNDDDTNNSMTFELFHDFQDDDDDVIMSSLLSFSSIGYKEEEDYNNTNSNDKSLMSSTCSNNIKKLNVPEPPPTSPIIEEISNDDNFKKDSHSNSSNSNSNDDDDVTSRKLNLAQPKIRTNVTTTLTTTTKLTTTDPHFRKNNFRRKNTKKKQQRLVKTRPQQSKAKTRKQAQTQRQAELDEIFVLYGIDPTSIKQTEIPRPLPDWSVKLTFDIKRRFDIVQNKWDDDESDDEIDDMGKKFTNNYKKSFTGQRYDSTHSDDESVDEERKSMLKSQGESSSPTKSPTIDIPKRSPTEQSSLSISFLADPNVKIVYNDEDKDRLAISNLIDAENDDDVVLVDSKNDSDRHPASENPYSDNSCGENHQTIEAKDRTITKDTRKRSTTTTIDTAERKDHRGVPLVEASSISVSQPDKTEIIQQELQEVLDEKNETASSINNSIYNVSSASSTNVSFVEKTVICPSSLDCEKLPEFVSKEVQEKLPVEDGDKGNIEYWYATVIQMEEKNGKIIYDV